MSSNLALSVHNLTKEYRIAHQNERPTTLGEALVKRIRNPLSSTTYETFRALDDVSFEVEKGEVLGVIGRNGAGKSTLLKILSRITEPTGGEVRLFGRIGSLLEVGTGFHPELSGRENIFLNGAILGMRHKEIARQFDAIVDFAEVERFLDTPVKRYSSGMYVRLAFAVAAHLNPEILVVDEVLAVGDAQFQKKCLGKMQEVSRQEGRTVLFVSHNMAAISALCTTCVFLKNGTVQFKGDVSRATQEYSADQYVGFKDTGTMEVSEDSPYRIVNVESDSSFDPDQIKTFKVQLEPTGRKYTKPLWISAHIVDNNGVILAQLDSRNLGLELTSKEAAFDLELTVAQPWLKPGAYSLDIFLCTPGSKLVEVQRAVSFSVGENYPYKQFSTADGYSQGLVLAKYGWSVSEIPCDTGPQVKAV